MRSLLQPLQVARLQLHARTEIVHYALRVTRVESVHLRRESSLQAQGGIYLVCQAVRLSGHLVQQGVAVGVVGGEEIVEHISVVLLQLVNTVGI